MKINPELFICVYSLINCLACYGIGVAVGVKISKNSQKERQYKNSLFFEKV